jgi:transcription antitermination factor NusA-like protein
MGRSVRGTVRIAPILAASTPGLTYGTFYNTVVSGITDFHGSAGLSPSANVLVDNAFGGIGTILGFNNAQAAAVSYNSFHKTLTSGGALGNIYAIRNTGQFLGDSANSNSYALIAGVINSNAIALGQVYFANGRPSGSNNFGNVSIENGKLFMTLSRSSNKFLEKLFELEIPEVFDGLITVKAVVREPGSKAKVAVESYDDRIDPVGACVGVKGARIHGIVRELRNENIDVINYTTNTNLYIQRALQPAVISRIELNETKGTADVYLDSDQVSLAIGRGGQNIKLAGKLTGYQIEVYRLANQNLNDEDDVDLEEFLDEIDEWIIEEFRKIGLDSAKAVINTPWEDLMRRTELEEETILEVQKILRSEFED